jgi:hypothetical protein
VAPASGSSTGAAGAAGVGAIAREATGVAGDSTGAAGSVGAAGRVGEDWGLGPATRSSRPAMIDSATASVPGRGTHVRQRPASAFQHSWQTYPRQSRQNEKVFWTSAYCSSAPSSSRRDHASVIASPNVGVSFMT